MPAVFSMRFNASLAASRDLECFDFLVDEERDEKRLEHGATFYREP
jgi:hypothetical protein